MYEETWLIQTLLDNTSYRDIKLATDTTIDLIHEDLAEPRIFVGHVGIKLEQPGDMRADGFHELENDEVLITTIQFLCKRSDLVTVRTSIKTAWSGKTPFPNDSDYGTLFFMEASVVAKTSNNVWWQELIGLATPRIS